MKPVKAAAHAGDPELTDLGWKLLGEGKMATIVLAGGMGTRLGFPHPKGLFPVSPVKHKSLFQLLAEKTVAASKKAGHQLLLAIMTSPENRAETEAYFDRHERFGLASAQLHFFNQGERRLEDEAGLPAGPLVSDGNGAVFQRFVESGLWKNWSDRGVSFLNIVLVDNPLADPWDANLLGFHQSRALEATVKCTLRASEHEKVGLIVLQDEKIKVIEYSEISDAERLKRDERGGLFYPYANLSLFCLSMPFVKRLSECEFPWHRAKKPSSVEPGSPVYWKKERFIFDLLSFTQKAELLVYPREECFSSLKNSAGADSPDTVRRDLELADLRLISQLTGRKVDRHPFELSAAFHYPVPEFIRYWSGRAVPPTPYIS